MSDKRCIGGCCDNRPGWEWIEDPVTHAREKRRQPPAPGQHGTPGHECVPRMAADGSYTCRACESFLGELIAGMPSYATDLRRAATHSAGTARAASPVRTAASLADWGKTGVSGKSGESSPDFAQARSRVEALGQLAYDVSWWVRHVSQERGLASPEIDYLRMPVLTVWRGSRWVGQHTRWLAAQPTADETLGGWKAMRSDAAHAMDLPRDRARFDVGPCPEDCDGTVRAFIGTEKADSAMGCDTNPEHQWNPSQFYRAGVRIQRKLEEGVA